MSILQPDSVPSTTALSENAPRSRRVITRLWGEALVIAVALILWAPRFSGPLDLRWDASVYYMLGTSLVKGEGYRIPSEPGSPEVLQYPPLLPLIAGLHQLASGTSDAAAVAPRLRITYAIIFIAYALVVLAFARRYLPPFFAVAATLLCLLNPLTVFLSDLFFAELPFAVITVLFALVADDRAVGRSWLREAGAYSLAAAAFLLRSAGLALLAAWVLQALMQRRWKVALARVLPAILPVVLWQIYITHVRSSSGYQHPAYDYQRASYQYYNVSYAENISLVDPFRPELGRLNRSTIATRLTTNVSAALGAVGETVSAKEEDWRGTLKWAHNLRIIRRFLPLRVLPFFVFAFAAAVVAGLVVLLYRRKWLVVFIVLGSVALVCTTPWPAQFTRYLEPLSPFLTVAAVLGLTAIGNVLQARRLNLGAISTWVIASLFLLCAVIVQIHTLLWLFSDEVRQRVTFVGKQLDPDSRWFLYDRTWQAWQKNVDWLEDHAPANAIVATTAAHFYYLQTGRLAVYPPMEVDPAQELRMLDSVPVSYVIVDELAMLEIARRYASPAVISDLARWRVVYSVDQTRLYQRSDSSP